MENLARLLPERFEFYHLGEVRLQAEGSKQLLVDEIPDDCVAIGFTFQGDLQAAMILLLNDSNQADAPDISMYSELGNIIASRWVNSLSRESNLDVVLSPPMPIKRGQLKLLSTGASEMSQRTYLHSHGNDWVSIQALLFSTAGSRS